jgi:AraC-like DNA-binding protein
MSRARTVRLKYPSAFINLVRALGADIDRRNVASALGIPLSTVYRWTSRPSNGATRFERGWTAQRSDAIIAELESLICECEQTGFQVRQGLATLAPEIFGNAAEDRRISEKDRTYHFLTGLKGQIVIGELSFPDGASGKIRQSIEVLDLLNEPSSRLRQRLLLAKMEIDQHYYTRLSCFSLARTVGMNRFNFIRAFRSLFGISPYRYLNNVRVERAKHMLALSTQSLQMIAVSVGFSSASSLTRAFKKFVGTSPANFVVKIAPASNTHDALAA